MCSPKGGIVNVGRWNWDGDVIVHDCIVPATRPVVGGRGAKDCYDIDVREYLLGGKNAVVRRAVEKQIPQLLERVLGGSAERFFDNRPGSFDYRASVVSAYVAKKVKYKATQGFDPWQLPDETLHLEQGDCEDRAILLAALLLASGVSAYNVRVALGRVHLDLEGGVSRPHDHAWVVYKTEAGKWTILDPPHRWRGAPKRGKGRSKVRTARYVPSYVFNDAHLWEAGPKVRPSFQELALRRKWKRLHPKFHGEVHHTIVQQALDGVAPEWIRDEVNSQFFSVFGQEIDEPDNFVRHGYDSLDHFDNGYVDESWKRVLQRLDDFQRDNRANIEAFAWAAHGIADFYAHTSYGHFARRDGRGLALYDPMNPDASLEASPDYSSGELDLGDGRFTTHPAWKKGAGAVPPLWDGKLLSGRYCQHGDAHDALERFTPSPSYLDDPGARLALPHHNEIAVDEFERPDAHRLYRPGSEYQQQFLLREQAAIRHIRQEFVARAKDVLG